LVLYASGTGTLISKTETGLAFKTGGQVTSIAVQVGQQVKAGDLLAQVDDASAQIAYTEAKRALMELTSPSAIAEAQTAVADAETEISSAQSHLEYVLGPNILYWEGEVSKAQDALDAAKAAAAKNPSDKDLQAAAQKAADSLAYVKDKLNGAWISYQKIYVPNHFTVTDRSTGQKYIAAPSDAEIMAARASLATAKATLQEANYLYDALTGGTVPEDATGSGLTALEQAKLNLQTAQDNLDGTKLVAPIDGTVMSIDTSVGDTVSSGTTAITVADLSQPSLDVYLDESDWGNIKAGYEADVTFDILSGKTFTGKVTQVDPGLYTSNGSSAVHAVVQLTGVDMSTFNLPLGTSASVDIIGGRADNAVLVPIEALHQAGDQYTVFVLQNGTPKLRVVQVGLQDSLYAQITSGLEAGETVTTGITETK
ncbi:MAG: efflux RND transporter periplasmic adaptor subunit, partial [Bacteroidota bacterium]